MRGVEFSLPWPSGAGLGPPAATQALGSLPCPPAHSRGTRCSHPSPPATPQEPDSGFMRSRGTRAAPSPVKASAMLLASLRFAQKSSSAGSCSHIPQAERGSVSVQVRDIPGQSCCLCRGWAVHSVSEGGLTFFSRPRSPRRGSSRPRAETAHARRPPGRGPSPRLVFSPCPESSGSSP